MKKKGSAKYIEKFAIVRIYDDVKTITALAARPKNCPSSLIVCDLDQLLKNHFKNQKKNDALFLMIIELNLQKQWQNFNSTRLL